MRGQSGEEQCVEVRFADILFVHARVFVCRTFTLKFYSGTNYGGEGEVEKNFCDYRINTFTHTNTRRRARTHLHNAIQMKPLAKV